MACANGGGGGVTQPGVNARQPGGRTHVSRGCNTPSVRLGLCGVGCGCGLTEPLDHVVLEDARPAVGGAALHDRQTDRLMDRQTYEYPTRERGRTWRITSRGAPPLFSSVSWMLRIGFLKSTAALASRRQFADQKYFLLRSRAIVAVCCMCCSSLPMSSRSSTSRKTFGVRVRVRLGEGDLRARYENRVRVIIGLGLGLGWLVRARVRGGRGRPSRPRRGAPAAA